MFITSEDPSFALSCQLCYNISECSLQATIVTAYFCLCAFYAFLGFFALFCRPPFSWWPYILAKGICNWMRGGDVDRIEVVLIKVVLAVSLALVLNWPVGFSACHEPRAVSRWGEKVWGAIYGGDQIPDTCFYTRLLNITIGIIYAPEHRDININLNQVCRLRPGLQLYL